MKIRHMLLFGMFVLLMLSGAPLRVNDAHAMRGLLTPSNDVPTLPKIANQFFQQAKLTASDGAASDYFGTAISIDGDTVVVGTQESIGTHWYQGSAYVFVKPVSGWANMTQVAKLTASDGTTNDYFGSAVAISGDTIVIGAYGDDATKGSVYVFVKPVGGWTNMTQTAKLTASDGVAGDDFGISVSISGDTIVVGSQYDDSGRGSAYVFVKPSGGWANMTQTAKLTASDRAADDWLGCSISNDGDVVVAGARGDNSHQGSAYVFVKPGGGWTNMTQTAKLTASDGVAGDQFGIAAIGGDTIVVGAYSAQVGSNAGQGSAYVFVKPGGGWANMTQTAKLTASDGAADDSFGFSTSISGDTVVVYSSIWLNSRGAVYVFAKPSGGWANMTQTTKLTASDAANGDLFGYSVDVSGNTIVAGAMSDDVGANTDQGSAYVFQSMNALFLPLILR